MSSDTPAKLSGYHGAGIVGTSNSLLKDGYSTQVRAAYADFVNLGLGASAYTLLALRSEEIRGWRNRVVFVDLAVTDQIIHGKIGTNFRSHRAIFESFLADCGEGHLLPVIHIMPSVWSTARHGIIRDTYLQYAANFALPFFDGFQYVERLRNLRPDLMQDVNVSGAHIDPPIARIIGRSLVRVTEHFKTRASMKVMPVTAKLRTEWLALPPFAPEHQQADRATRLLQRRVISLRPGEGITVSLPSDAQILGYSANAGASNGLLIMEGERTVAKDLRNLYYRGPEVLVHVSWAMLEPLAARDGKIKLSCRVAPDLLEGEVGESNEIFMPNCKVEEVKVELDGLIIGLPREGGARPAFSGASLDLLESLSDEELLADSHAEDSPAPQS